ncbi:MAG TPA: D-glycerate dehydrogenase [Dehalococcoidia bacterium]|nr:D-glycerate dehydrogenase [Chloroflexota bacterium]HCI86546.1 D-glycerate dehydrogenase [Dehalococcoidia bacterium]|tara:strand:+ start:2196 stop:3185 length:990 start_codon:yes stop_codon:yes gene_type:complete
MPKILVTRRTFSEAAEALRASGAEVVIWDGEDAPSHQDLIDAVADVDGLYAHITNQVNDEVMDAAPNLKVISEFGVGYDNIDVNAANERGIAVCNTPGILSESTADEAFALLASMARRTYGLPAMVKRGEWGDFDPLGLLASDIHHKTLGIVGMGNIGSEMAKRAAGFNMNVLYYNRNRRDEEFGATYVDSLEEILERSDFVSLHNPLTPETTNMMSIDQFKLMKKSAILINTTRGPVVDQDALYEALVAGEIAGAALDVTVPEPIPADHPLLTLDNCLIMPHVASATYDTRMKMAMMCVENVLAGIAGDWPPYCVNETYISCTARLKA